MSKVIEGISSKDNYQSESVRRGEITPRKKPRCWIGRLLLGKRREKRMVEGGGALSSVTSDQFASHERRLPGCDAWRRAELE
jgi:hypothetical protein